MNREDRDLRDRFATLRREETASPPEFERLLRRAPRPRPEYPRIVLAATLGFAFTIAAILALRPTFQVRRLVPGGTALSITQWTPPTDFLLDTPGSDLLRTVPAIGVAPKLGSFPKPLPNRREVANKAVR
jgi:hypothetical protein